uniref:Secreted protein n=1 Tax=Physcomitrium patens TaxID=3218 RepID=A0A2K1JFX0_PHYPA|nr:hypothetical protein PHYPA_017830 [Physcomitrium patens]PNR40432.1 hypothetical protein PHYPA_017834 [Physcomitrium patens]
MDLLCHRFGFKLLVVISLFCLSDQFLLVVPTCCSSCCFVPDSWFAYDSLPVEDCNLQQGQVHMSSKA